jgi:hypothetical protein
MWSDLPLVSLYLHLPVHVLVFELQLVPLFRGTRTLGMTTDITTGTLWHSSFHETKAD